MCVISFRAMLPAVLAAATTVSCTVSNPGPNPDHDLTVNDAGDTETVQADFGIDADDLSAESGGPDHSGTVDSFVDGSIDVPDSGRFDSETGSTGDLPDATDPDVADPDCAESDSGPDPDAWGPWPEPVEGQNFRRHGPYILDSQSRALMLHSANVSNYAKYSSDRLPWHTFDSFVQLASIGIDSIRLQTYWAAIEPEMDVFDDVYIEKFAALVRAAGDAGLLVVVDMHQDIFGVGFHEDGAPLWACDSANYESYVPTQPWSMNYLKDEVRNCFDAFYGDDEIFGQFVDAWRHLAERLKNDPAVVGFDILNEPNWGRADVSTFMPEIWQPRMEQVADALLSAAPDKLVFMEPTTLWITVGLPEPVRHSRVDRMVFAPHFYHPNVHDGAGYDRPTHRDLVIAAVSAMDETSAGMGGYPIWVGEFGGPWNVDGFADYMGDLISAMYSVNAGWAVYSDDLTNDDGFGIRRSDGTFKPDAVAVVGHPRAHAVPGTVVRQDLDPDMAFYSLAFKWEVDAGLEIWDGNPGDTGVEAPCVHPQAEEHACTACFRSPDRAVGFWTCTRPVESIPGAVWEVTMNSGAADGIR